MITGLIAYTLVAGTLVALAALAAEAACRYASLPRRWAWFGGMVLVVALAVVSPLEPVAAIFPGSGTTIDVLEPAGANAGEAALNQPEVALSLSATVLIAVGILERQLLIIVSALDSTIDGIFGERALWAPAAMWGATSALLLLLITAVHLRYRRARQRWRLVQLHGIRALVTPNAGPAVVGATAPDIIVPEWLLQRSSDEQKLVLAHEQEHVERRDPLLLATAWFLVVLVPWHPALWWMLNRMRLAVEIDCDARILARGTARQTYGALLIDMSQQSHGLPLGATALADRTTHLERRLIAMNSKMKSYPRLRTAGFAVTALAVVLAACETRMPTSAEVDAVDASVIEGMTRKLWSSPDTSIVYYVDGVRVDETAGRSVPSKSIATVEVKRADDTRPFSEIHITTANKVGYVEMERDVRVPDRDSIRLRGDSLLPTADQVTLRLNSRDTARAPGDTVLLTVPRLAADPVIAVDGVIQTGRGDYLGPIPGQPMIIIDGVIQADNRSEVRQLNIKNDDIESIEVIRGEAALRLYGARAANGVINIKTKK